MTEVLTITRRRGRRRAGGRSRVRRPAAVRHAGEGGGDRHDPHTLALGEEIAFVLSRARSRRLRSMREFAEAELIIPDGPFKGRRFNCARQPFNALWFGAVDDGRWTRFWATGPSQSSKTLCCFIVPLLYHLFEIGETVICAVPDMNMAGDKYHKDILPAILASRYGDLLPVKGPGSRGGAGKLESVYFRNGAMLKFMSGGGDDKRRAHFTARVVVITEADALDESGGESREADKLTQIEARTRAFGDRKRIYGECTLSIETGRTYREIKGGTNSRIALPCPKCRAFVTPEREHLRGWEAAETKPGAKRLAMWCCPACGKPWSEEDRHTANAGAVLLHGDQRVKRTRGGRVKIEGEEPETDTLGFRWSAVNNSFLTAGEVGADCWEAARDPDEENAEKYLCQFVFAVPYKPPILELSPLSSATLTRRVSKLRQGIVPDGTQYLTAGVDLGKFIIHYAVLAWMKDGSSHIVEYGRREVATVQLGPERAIQVCLREFREDVMRGWPLQSGGGVRVPDQVWVDAGWMPEPVKLFCRESIEPDKRVGWQRFRPSIGRGVGQKFLRSYSAPKKTGAEVQWIGEQYHIVRQKGRPVYLVEVNSDYWKTFVHDRLACPSDTPGAMTVYDAPPNEHLQLAKHLTAEKQIQEFVLDKGTVIRWKAVNKNNHWFDAIYNACAAGHLCGVRLVQSDQPAAAVVRPDAPRLRMPDSRPFLVTER